VFLDPPTYITRRWDALAHLAKGQVAPAVAALQESDAAAPAVRGKVNGRPVEGWRDADDLLAPILEVMVLRDYVWVPWAQVQELEIQPPARPRDLLWAPARLVLTDGQQRNGYLPVLYPGTHTAADDALKLGRLTDWLTPDNDGPVRGLGQHLLVGGDVELALLEVRTFEAS
jgi:type VI secretion system protein ImpE